MCVRIGKHGCYSALTREVSPAKTIDTVLLMMQLGQEDD